MIQADKSPTPEQLAMAASWLDVWPAGPVHTMEEAFTGTGSVEFYHGMVAALSHGRRILDRMLEQKQSPELMQMTFSAYLSCAARQALRNEKQNDEDH